MRRIGGYLLLLAAISVALLPLGFSSFARAQEAAQPDGNWVVPFQAFAQDGGALLFTGEYTVERKGGMLHEVQTYRNAAGTVVHKVDSIWDEANHRPVYYESESFTGKRAAVAKVSATGLDYQLKDNQDNTSKTGHRDPSDSTYLWPNLVPLVQINWDAILKGKTLPAELFFASLGNTVAINVAKDEPATLDGAPVQQFKVTAANAFVRMIMSPMKLTFSADPSHRLLVFEGRSVVEDTNRKNYDLRMVFGAPKQN